jgi:predicted DNA-binding transcriptional regulator AlpA
MGKIERISKIGLWPRLLGADAAAIYCNVCKSGFYERVESGVYPQGFTDGGLVQWDRFDLDEAIEQLKRAVKTPQSDQLTEELTQWTPASSAS